MDNFFNKILKVSHCKYDYLCLYQISAASHNLCHWLLIITIWENLFNFQFKTSSAINVHTNWITTILLTINTAEPGLFIYILPEISPFPTTPPRIFPQWSFQEKGNYQSGKLTQERYGYNISINLVIELYLSQLSLYKSSLFCIITPQPNA